MAVEFASVLNPDDVRMGQTRGEFCLAVEPRPVLGIVGELCGQHFERILARQARMRRQIHRAHAAGTQHAQDGVSGESLPSIERHGVNRLSE